MKISVSPNWTLEERLGVIAALSQIAWTPRAVEASLSASNPMHRIYCVSIQSAEYLEKHRQQIFGDELQNIFSTTTAQPSLKGWRYHSGG